jgi:murein L,D-transpeptidase YafK
MKKKVWGLVWLCIIVGIFSAGLVSAEAVPAGAGSAEAVTTEAVTTEAVSAEEVSAEEVSAEEVSGEEVSAEEVSGEEVSGEEVSVPAAVISMPPDRYVVLVEKQTQRIYVYRSGPDDPNRVPVFEAACSTGEMPGPKQVEGDKKTPEGIYFVLEVFEEKYLTPVYGSRALTLDYPNFFDQQQGKTGYAIWIHGTNKVLKPMDTNGCVALENPDVAALARYVTPHVTPVIIQEAIETIALEDLAEKRHVVTAFVADWVQAQLSGTLGRYQAFYAPSYLPDSREREDWDALRRSLDPSMEPLEIQVSDLGIYAHQDTLIVVMAFALALGDEVRDLGRRKLFVQQDETGRLQIVGDRFQVPDNTLTRSLAVLAKGAQSLRRSHDSQTALPHK